MYRRIWAWIGMIVLCWKFTAAQNYEIYVFTHPFSGKVITRNGKMYVSLNSLAKAMHLSPESKKGTVWIGKQPTEKINAPIFLNGQPFTDGFQSKDNQWYVALKPFVEATENKYLFNKDTKIIDILPKNSSLTQKKIEQLAKTLKISSQEGSSNRTIDFSLNPMIKLDFKSKSEIYQLRRSAVYSHPEILDFYHIAYHPSEAIFGQIQDGKPWWGILGLSYYGPGSQSIEGLSWHSLFLMNPYLLVGVTNAFSTPVKDSNIPPKAFFPEPLHLSWNLKQSRVDVEFNVTEYAEGLQRINGPDPLHPALALTAYNARDLGFPYLYIVPEETSNVMTSGPKDEAISIPQYFHTGGSCGYPGGCNNMSPTFAPLEIKVEQLPAVATIKLWRKQPQSVRQAPDITVILKMI